MMATNIINPICYNIWMKYFDWANEENNIFGINQFIILYIPIKLISNSWTARVTVDLDSLLPWSLIRFTIDGAQRLLFKWSHDYAKGQWVFRYNAKNLPCMSWGKRLLRVPMQILITLSRLNEWPSQRLLLSRLRPSSRTKRCEHEEKTFVFQYQAVMLKTMCFYHKKKKKWKIHHFMCFWIFWICFSVIFFRNCDEFSISRGPNISAVIMQP